MQISSLFLHENTILSFKKHTHHLHLEFLHLHEDEDLQLDYVIQCFRVGILTLGVGIQVKIGQCNTTLGHV